MQMTAKPKGLAKIWREVKRPFRQARAWFRGEAYELTYYQEVAKKRQLAGENTWEQSFAYSPAMQQRTQKMVSLLQERNIQSLMDLGCGQQECSQILAEGIAYYPVDLYAHCPDTHIMDLNAGEFLEIPVDVIFCSGSLEYIYDLDRLIGKFVCYGKSVLCSYCTTDTHPSRNAIWVNHFSHSGFIQLFQRHGYTLSQEILPSDESSGNHIYFFDKQVNS